MNRLTRNHIALQSLEGKMTRVKQEWKTLDCSSFGEYFSEENMRKMLQMDVDEIDGFWKKLMSQNGNH